METAVPVEKWMLKRVQHDGLPGAKRQAELSDDGWA
jgi:hypothetical protein